MAIVQGRQLDVDANPRAVIGGNKPPLDEQVVIDLNEALSEKGITKRIAELIASFERAPTVIENADTAGKVADLIKQMSAAAKAVTAERETINRPILNAQRSLKGRADSIIDDLQSAANGLTDRIETFASAFPEGEVARGDYGAKIVRTAEYKHEIEGVRKLPDSILEHEKVLEAINKVIAAQVRGGTREMKGVRIFSETATTIR